MDERRTSPKQGPKAGPRPPARSAESESGPAILPWLVVFLLIAFIGGMLLSPWFEQQVRPRLPFPYEPDVAEVVTARLDSHEQAIERLESRVAALEQRPGLPSLPAQTARAEEGEQPALNDPVLAAEVAEQASTQITRLETRVDALDRQQSQLGGRVDNLSAEVAGLTVRVQDSRGESAARVARAEELAREARAVILIAQARRAFAAGEPLGPLEPALRSALGADADDALDDLSAGMRGLVRPPALAARFERLAPQLLDSSAAEGEQGWWQSFTGGLADIFQVRRADTDSSAERAEDIVAEVEEEIEAGDVEGAVAAYRRLPDDIQRRGARWLRDAQRYVQTENLLARLEARVVDASGELTAPREAPAQDSSGTTQL
ncbi:MULTISPECIES: COG4223 family protein [Pacificimonas]|uniref:Inner membrane protein n=1 Tax=Pacificimonas aurantium TaxID=1250540 RepID=A0ABS7WHS3_9SPHN|nr:MULTISPECIES: hypothetical protein [Pacificimonas]MBZ6377555.1 hypothetical protein [Pacificimonas aurantium]